MYQNIYKIEPSSFVTDIVVHDYRTADVFRKYDIDFCCGGKWPLDIVCQNKNLHTEEIIGELQKIVTQSSSNAAIDFDSWEIDFLADYIYNVHHRYLKKALLETKEQVNKFLDEHRKKFPELEEIETIMNQFMKEIPSTYETGGGNIFSLYKTNSSCIQTPGILCKAFNKNFT